MSCILITGGGGFIGSCFVEQWLAEEQLPVLVLDKLTYAGSLENLASACNDHRFRFIEGDIGDPKLVESLLAKHKPRAVINFAAESHVDRSIDSPDTFVQTNVVGTVQLLASVLSYWKNLEDEKKKQFRFLHISTDEVYGSLGPTGAFTETSPYQPNSPYAASKASSDHFVRAYHQTYGLPTIITNGPNNYGPRQLPEKLVPLMILNAIEGKRLPVYGDGKNVRDWLYVEDHCHALQLILAKGRIGEVYNIGGNCERTNLEMVHAICEMVERLVPNLPHSPCQSLIDFVEDRPGHDRRYAIDSTKIRQQLDWKPKCDFNNSLQQTVQWYLDNPTWVEHRASSRQRLGLTCTRSRGEARKGAAE